MPLIAEGTTDGLTRKRSFYFGTQRPIIKNYYVYTLVFYSKSYRLICIGSA